MGWLDDYLAYNKRQESPALFHYWSALTTVAGVLNRQVWLDKVSDGILRYTIYPGQLMVWLVARSAIDRKSTSILLPGELLQLAGVELIHGTCSPEELLHSLGAHGTHPKKGIVTILSSELSVFYSTQQYNTKLIDIMTDMADAPSHRDYKTRGGGSISINDACVTFLGCTTPSSIADAIPARAHAHGFAGRHIVVHPIMSNGPRIAEALAETHVDPLKTQAARDKKQHLFRGLLRFQKLKGPFDYTPQANKWYEAWYRMFIDRVGDSGEGWLGRRQDHLLRVAMIIQVCKNETLTLEESTLIEADKQLSIVETTMDEAFAHVGVHANTRGIERIVAIFKKYGGQCDNFTLLEQAMVYFPDFQSLKRTVNDMTVLKWIRRVRYDAATGLEVFELVRPDQRQPGQQPVGPNSGGRPSAAKLSEIVADMTGKTKSDKS